jgi:hypothetical protein
VLSWRSFDTLVEQPRSGVSKPNVIAGGGFDRLNRRLVPGKRELDFRENGN